MALLMSSEIDVLMLGWVFDFVIGGLTFLDISQTLRCNSEENVEIYSGLGVDQYNIILSKLY